MIAVPGEAHDRRLGLVERLDEILWPGGQAVLEAEDVAELTALAHAALDVTHLAVEAQPVLILGVRRDKQDRDLVGSLANGDLDRCGRRDSNPHGLRHRHLKHRPRVEGWTYPHERFASVLVRPADAGGIGRRTGRRAAPS